MRESWASYFIGEICCVQWGPSSVVMWEAHFDNYTMSTVPSCGQMKKMSSYSLLYFNTFNKRIEKRNKSKYFILVLNHIPSNISLFLSLSLTIHTQRRSGEHREGHWRHPLLTFFPLKQPALSVIRTGRRVKHWGRGAEANRKPVGIRPLHYGPAHLTHCWHFTLVHVTYPTLNNAKSHM